MAAVNSVQNGLHLPLTGIAPPRVLMCSASMGAEGSVTLQLREAVQAPESGSSLDTALTIGYPDPEILADVLGTLQAAALNNNNTASGINGINGKSSDDNSSENNIINNEGIVSCNSSGSQTCSNAANINSSSSNCSSRSSISSNSSSSSESSVPVPNPPIVIKKPRLKTSSPTRHGPQQCQVCSKVFGNASALAKHKLTHSDERKYVCAMCSKAFKRQDHLNGHMLTHRNKKPYECKAEGCGKSYCDARSLRRHTENHHSALAITASTPNQSLSPSTGTPTGLSLSPATASGDASSPHGANCVQYINNVDALNSKPASPGSPARNGNEGLTRQQLDLISQIMQQTKQAGAHIAVSMNSAGSKTQQQRPRTWNMQTQLQQQNQSKMSPNVENYSSVGTSTSSNEGNCNQSQQQPQHSPEQLHQQIPVSHTLNIIKVEQKPVECNLCHRKFKNIPALNGHMRLHGGYFKKDTEAKKCEKKENPGPPLQTASIGVRALIEEKIISKRSKDLKGAFVVPAPPLTTVRRAAEGDNFLTPKTPLAVSTNSTPSGTITNVIPANNAVTTTLQMQKPTIHKISTSCSSIGTQKRNPDIKDATLIELLKRGTKIAVKRTCSDPGQTVNASTKTTAMNLTSDLSVAASNTPNASPPLSVPLSGEPTPLALTISQAPSGTTDVFTLTYSTDSSSGFFGESDVYSVSDTAMLLQAVDSIQLLNDSTTADQLDEIASLSEYSLASEPNQLSDTNSLSRDYTPSSKQLQAVLDSPLPDSLAEFSALHAKDYVLYNCPSRTSPGSQSTASSLPSPLAYPTPPASHEPVTQASPFLDDSHRFSDANSFFDDKPNTFIDDNNGQFFKRDNTLHLTENEKILKLKHELFNESKSVYEDSERFFKSDETNANEFESAVKVEDLLNETNAEQCELKDFGHQNLSFLDEAPNFLDDSRNPNSPLSASFFNTPLTNAEEVKEVLKEVLPNQTLNSGNNCENDIDLYYLPGLTLQSQMMPNSDDPLLSSSPKDFIQKTQQQLQQYEQQQPVQHLNCEMNASYSPSVTSKSTKLKINEGCSNLPSIQTNPLPQTSSDRNNIISINQLGNLPNCTQLMKSSIPSGSSSLLKRRLRNNISKRSQIYHSKLRRPSSTHYTPPPMLNPDRKGAGLYSSLRKSVLQEAIDLVDDFDESASLVAFLDESKVNIGTAYQATIPIPVQNTSYQNEEQHFEELMWHPNIANEEKLLTRFIELSKSSAVPLGFHSEEVALKALLEANGETHVAVLSLLQAPSSTLHLKWQSHEVEIFLRGLERYGKNFHRISQEIVTKSASECVQLYYFWKKLCVNYKITHLKQDALDADDHSQPHSSHSEARPHVCEMPDCSASFTSRAALHGHTRIHCIGRSLTQLGIGQSLLLSNSQGLNLKDDFPCKVCGKVFNKVKSRSAHMKSHRPQENDTSQNST